jgi:hypothetical protein
MEIIERIGRHVIRVIRDDERAELKAERDFLLERMTGNQFDWVGESSNAMVAQAMWGTKRPLCFPRDSADLMRCEETYRRAPKHLQKKMLPTLEKFREDVKTRYR